MSRNGTEALKVNAVKVLTGENLDKPLRRLIPGKSDPDENYRSKVEDGKIILEIKINKIEDKKLKIEYDLNNLNNDADLNSIAYYNTESAGVTPLTSEQMQQAATPEGVNITLLYKNTTQKFFLDESKIQTHDPYATLVFDKNIVDPSNGYKNVTVTVTVTATDEMTKKPYRINFIVDQNHVWQEPKWTWNDDNTATVTFTCDNLAHATGKINETESPAVTMTKTVKTEATCISRGTTEYKGKVNFEGRDYESDVKTVSTSIDINNHDWNSVSYSWSDNGANGKACTAKRVCKNDSTHIETAEGTVTKEQTKAPTCTEKGKANYTAVFTKEWAVKQTLTAEIPANGHKDDDNDKICNVCGAQLGEKPSVTPPSYPSYPSGGSVHTHTLTLVSGKPAACTEDGAKDYYKCSGCGRYFEDQNAAKEIKNPDEWKVIKALGHKDANNDYVCDVCGATLDSTSENSTYLTDIFETDKPDVSSEPEVLIETDVSTAPVTTAADDEQAQNTGADNFSDKNSDKIPPTGNGGFEPLAVLSVISLIGIGGTVIYGQKRKGGK